MDLGSNWHDSILEDFRPCTRPIVVAVNHRLLSRWDLKAGLPLKSDSEVSPISKEDWVALKIQCKCKLDFPLHNTVFENYKKVSFFGQKVLPDTSLLIGQKLVKNALIEKFKCDILGYFQPLCILVLCRINYSLHRNGAQNWETTEITYAPESSSTMYYSVFGF